MEERQFRTMKRIRSCARSSKRRYAMSALSRAWKQTFTSARTEHSTPDTFFFFTVGVTGASTLFRIRWSPLHFFVQKDFHDWHYTQRQLFQRQPPHAGRRAP